MENRASRPLCRTQATNRRGSTTVGDHVGILDAVCFYIFYALLYRSFAYLIPLIALLKRTACILRTRIAQIQFVCAIFGTERAIRLVLRLRLSRSCYGRSGCNRTRHVGRLLKFTRFRLFKSTYISNRYRSLTFVQQRSFNRGFAASSDYNF